MRVMFLTNLSMSNLTYQRSFFLGKNLSRLGNDITIVCAGDKSYGVSFIDKVRVIHTLPTISLPINEYGKCNVHLAKSVFEWYTSTPLRTIASIIHALTNEYDLVHCFSFANPQAGIPALFSKKFKKEKVLIDWDDDWKTGLAKGFNPVKRLLFGTLEDGLPRIADGVTAVSDFLIGRAKNLGVDETKIYKVPNGANVDEIKPLNKIYAREKMRLPLDKPILVSIGNFSVPALSLLFKAFSMVIREIPDAKLVMVGSTLMHPSLEDFYRRKLSHNVLLVGFRPSKEVPYYLGAADALVLAMDNSVFEKARWPGRLGVYLAAGRLIVSNAVGEVKNLLENEKCGLCSQPTDVKDFSEKIMISLKDHKLQEKMGKQARKIAEEKYSWAKIAEGLNAVYEGMVN